MPETPGRGVDGRAAGGPSPRPPRTVTKKELVTRLSDRTGVTKVVVKDLIQMFLDEIVSELGRGNRIEFREFGVFETKERAARPARNPHTGEKVRVPRRRIVKFKVGRLMRERVARGEDAPPPRGARPNQV